MGAETPYLDLWANEEFVARLDRQAVALEAIALRTSRPWEPFRYLQGGVTDGSGDATVSFAPCPVGWEWQLGRIAVSVDGASSAATLGAFINSADDSTLVDWAAGLFGSNPSRNISDNPAPIYLADGEQFVIQVVGAVAAQNVLVRIQGFARELEGGWGC